jgi:hypothetical protein
MRRCFRAPHSSPMSDVRGDAERARRVEADNGGLSDRNGYGSRATHHVDVEVEPRDVWSDRSLESRRVGCSCSRVSAGAPPIRTSMMGWCALDLKKPETVLYVSDAPALTPEAPYEIEHGEIPQVAPANFKTGIRVVFPQKLLERGDDLLVYYGAADVSVAARACGNATSPRQSN